MKKNLFLLGAILGNILLPVCGQNAIDPMVSATWSQSSPFNNECPVLANGERAAAGCGAIAVAQIMSYYRMPVKGFGHVAYNNIDIDYDSRSIDWPNILDNYQSGGTDIQKAAVASLIYQVGAAMKMGYNSVSSPANYPSMMWGLQHYLHFSPYSRYRNRHYYSTAEWIEMLNNELEANHPVFYRGDHTNPGNIAGHIFVIDGRDNEGHYHINFGHASSKQDKFVDLNVINQGDSVYSGDNCVSYHHRQAMITDFFPVEELDDSSFDRTAIVLNSPIILGKRPNAKTIEAKKGIWIEFQFRYVNFDNAPIQFSVGFYRGKELCGVSQTIRTTSAALSAGQRVNVGRNFVFPDSLADGAYELSIISRDDENSSWVRGWDNALNNIPVKVKDGLYTFTLPNYHTLESDLYLDGKGIVEVENTRKDGKTLQLTVCNSSDNNFEDSLRVVISSNGRDYYIEMPTSIYEGQKVTYRFFVSDTLVDLGNTYMVRAYYKETNTGEWVMLTDTAPNAIRQPDNPVFEGLEIYTINGVMIEKIERGEIDSTYSAVISRLSRGVYIIRDKNGTRKFIKRRD
ncbi:MAG: C10 family peptidase [Bacteroidaceae bacterium]|nr:C10 family peptidase [Bacteroidaceae bacterium]